jgi:hypothetical protein
MTNNVLTRAVGFDVENRLRNLLKGEFSSLSLSFNDLSAPCYQTVEACLANGIYDNIDWISEEEKQKAIKTNSMWTLHWYPDTPIGFYCIAASSLSAIFSYLETRDA